MKKIENRNLVGRSTAEMLNHIFECHDEIRNLKKKLLAGKSKHHNEDAILTSAMHSDGEGRCECADHQGGPCSFCMEAKYNL